jgi:uncharacterized membrane protein
VSEQQSVQTYPQHQVIYQNIVREPSNGAAVASLVLGIVAIAAGVWIVIPILGLFMMFLAFLPAVLAVVFGHVGLVHAARAGRKGHGQAVTGLILGYATLGISVLTTFVWIVAAGSAAAGR